MLTTIHNVVSCYGEEDTEESFSGMLGSIMEESMFNECFEGTIPTHFEVCITVEKKGYGKEEHE